MIKKYKEWFSNLGKKTPIIEKQYKPTNYFFDDKKRDFVSTILEKQVIVKNTKLSILSTLPTEEYESLIFIFHSNLNIKKLTEGEYTKEEVFHQTLAYFEYYRKQEEWKPEQGKEFLRIFRSFDLTSELMDIVFLPIQDFFPLAVPAYKTFKVLMCIALTPEESDFLEEYGQEMLVDKLRKCEVDVFDFTRKSCI